MMKQTMDGTLDFIIEGPGFMASWSSAGNLRGRSSRALAACGEDAGLAVRAEAVAEMTEKHTCGTSVRCIRAASLHHAQQALLKPEDAKD